ncbi:rab2a member ras oncogene family [Anaeramoeba ignava]|uniref:Rab2a member ras oncogene family n=1 Tax=Anaeramoeba ignava TaxID=1746090 RepID=A0A9Q0LV12_ANAIG|nr:rab2a member ras oncogene family [Anaeramoeba ignava]
MSHSDYDFCFKIVIVGDPHCGKSCILIRYTEDKFTDDYETTLSVGIGTRMIKVDNFQLKLDIWDTAGQDTFKALTKSYFRGAAGAFVVYDITRKDTFETAKVWMNDLRDEVPGIPIILIGNKYDLAHRRQVTSEQAEGFANENKILFQETSAKEGIGIEDAFRGLSKKILIQAQKGENKEVISGKKSSPNIQISSDFEEQKKNKCC